MGADTRIEWADHTFNPWIGCTKVSPACDHCYAETLATNRLGVAWGPHAKRRRTKPSTWKMPLAWNRRAEREGVRYRVFCASLADVFDNAAPPAWRCDLWDLIAETPHLDWLLLTKRPENIAGMLPQRSHGALMGWGPVGYTNVWLGTTVENQAEADRRIPHLMAVPAAKRFLSMEPLLGPVDLTAVRWPCQTEHYVDCLRGGYWNMAPYLYGAPAARPGAPRGGFTNHSDMPGQPHLIGWIIAGGESGPKARPCSVPWMRSLRDQCAAAGVPFFLKQWGEWWPQECHPWPEGSFAAALKRAGIDKPSPEHPRRGVFGFDDVFREGSISGGPPLYTHWRIGKKAAGARLDGREWREVPR